MRYFIFLLLASVLSDFAQAQTQVSGNDFRFPKKGRIVLSALPEQDVEIQTLEIHQPHFKQLDAIKRPYPFSPSEKLNKKKATPDPVAVHGFAAQGPTGTPLDNNMAISRGGFIISAVNTTIRVLDSAGTNLFSRSLAGIANELGSLTRTFDPHALYDPEEDRFILMFLNGSDHTNTEIIIGFSETNDPRQGWNFYSVPGNTTTNEWWSDYPFMGISKKELFVSVLLWKDGETGWDTDAVNENLWQIDKASGYAGDSLLVKQYHSVQHGGKQLWNSRPMGGGDRLYESDFYFLGNRPKDQSNDTIFLMRISGTVKEGNAQLQLTALRANQAYGLQPNVTQLGGRRLRTNYCDIQNGYHFEDRLYFCANTRHPQTGRPAIYVGRVVDLNGTPKVEGQIFGVDSLDLNYPSMAYSGGGWPDESAMVMCLHNSQNSFPGTSVFAMGRDYTPSDLVRLKAGEGAMDILAGDSLERWGDYTGIQRDYAHTGRVWLAGSYGREQGTSQTWMACVSNQDPMLGVAPEELPETRVYPNPGSYFYLEFPLTESGEVRVQLYAADGKMLFDRPQSLMAGKQRIRINPGTAVGVYKLVVRDAQGGILLHESIVVEP